ncbi:MAG: hypothetical protein JO015_15250 [Verrucomicrobia bacterium]|nr:hypothetical protein [Verrucomicrobiota bacterium]
MKTPFLVAGVLVTGMSVLLGEARAGPFGGGFRGGGRAVARRGFGLSSRSRFIGRHRRYPVFPVLGYNTFALPWVYPPTDGYLYDYPGGDYAAVDAGPRVNPVPVVVPQGPVPGAYSPNPVYIIINPPGAAPAAPPDGGPGTTAAYRAGGSIPDQTGRSPEVQAPAVPVPDHPAPLPSPTPGPPAGIFDNLALVSWSNANGKDTVLLENTETKAVRQITSEPDRDNLRVVEVRPSVNPNLSEVVISNGTDQRAIRFRSRGGP